MHDDVELRPVRPEDLPIHYAQQRGPASSAMAAVPARDREAFDAHCASPSSATARCRSSCCA